MNPKSTWQRPALAWLQRSMFHLSQHRSEALATDDAAAYRADVQSIRALEVFIYLIQRDERQRRRERREQLQRLREVRSQDTKLLRRLVELEESYELPIAA
jgi:hypothetical protein